jgi:hypothetical protein
MPLGKAAQASSRTSPVSPSTTNSGIAVGTPSNAAIIQSIEDGDYSSVGGDDETRSLTESIRQHIVEGGLRYHAYHAGKYLFPNDENEQMREDLKHDLTRYLCEGNLFFAPVHDILERGGQVLDLGEFLPPSVVSPKLTCCQGTGTGKWCIEREYLGIHLELI